MFTLNDITRITGGNLISGNGLKSVRRICIDTRKVRRGDLFIAVKGHHLDGHDFIQKAFSAGAAAVVVSRSIAGLPNDRGVIKVDDTIRALGLIARAYLKRFNIPVIAITGSAGKTTTKELVAVALGARFKVLRNSGTENNQFGVPLTILKLKPRHQILVLELGTNRPGDIPWLASIVNPDVAILTNIGESHLQQLKTPANVFKEKMALVSNTKSAGTVIINNDDPFFRKIPLTHKEHRIITYGVDRPADYRATDIQTEKNGGLRFRVNDAGEIRLNMPAVHNVYNALAAVSCGRLFNIPFESISKQLSRSGTLKGRQYIKKTAGFWIIDDTYNANPVSFRSAVATLAGFNTGGRKILACADMLELGKETERLHSDCGRLAARAGVDVILAYGLRSKNTIKAARQTGAEVIARHFNDLDGLQRCLAKTCLPGDVILVKGSRGMQMERTVAFLQKHFCQSKGK